MILHMARRFQRVNSDESGAIAVMFAIMLVVMVGMAAFAVDLGYARAAQQQLRTSADSASLAAAGVLANEGVYCQPDPSGTTATLVFPKNNESAATAAAITAAKDYDQRNREQGFSTDPTTVTNTVTGPTCVKYPDPALVIAPWYPTVTVSNEQQLNTTFGRILGQDTITPAGQASAVVQAVAAEFAGLRPFGVCSKADPNGGLELLQDATTSKVVRIQFDNKTGACGGATTGNWGILDMNGGSNPTGETEEWTRNGYRGPINPNGVPPGQVDATHPWVVEGNPGNFGPGALQAELDSIVGKEITLPFFNNAYGNGANAKFDVVGFVTVKLCGWRDSSQKYNHSGCEGTALYTSSFPNGVGNSYVKATLDGKADKDTYFDVQYRGTATVEDLLNGCQVTGQCDTGKESVRLATRP